MVLLGDVWPHRMLGTGFYLWNALLAQSTQNSRIAHDGCTFWVAEYQFLPIRLGKRTLHAFCMIRKLEQTLGHNSITFRFRKEGSFPGTCDLKGSVLTLHRATSLLMGWGIHRTKGMRPPGIQQSPLDLEQVSSDHFWGLLQTSCPSPALESRLYLCCENLATG